MAILKLINKYFLKSIVGPLCAFGLPLFFVLMFFAMGKNQFAIALPVVVSIGILAVTLMIIPTLIIELRKSLILKRIGTSQITTHHFVFILVVYFYAWIGLTIAYSFALFAIIAPLAISDYNAIWRQHHIASTIYACVLLGTLGIVIAVFIGTFCKNAMIASAVAFILIFFSMFTAGLLMPFSLIRQIDAMVILNYFLPLNWPMLMMQEAWGVSSFELVGGLPSALVVASNNIWDLTPLKINAFQFGGLKILADYEVISTGAKLWHMVGPYVVLGGLTTAIALAFRWTER